MKLFPRIWYFVKFSARKSYSVCVEAGEKLAWFFGITKPKYHSEIQHYESMNEEVYLFKCKYFLLYVYIIYRNEKHGDKHFKILNILIIF